MIATGMDRARRNYYRPRKIGWVERGMLRCERVMAAAASLPFVALPAS